MKLLLFEDIEAHGTAVSKELVKIVPGAEVLWFGTVKGHTLPVLPHPFLGGPPSPLRSECKVVTAKGTTSGPIDLWQGELAGAILDIYVKQARVGEGIARWLEYARFSGPVLLYSGYDLPPTLPALPRIFEAKKTDPPTLPKMFCDMLDRAEPIARVNSRGIPPGGADRVTALQREPLDWDWLWHDNSMGPITELFGRGRNLTRARYADDKPVLATNCNVERLAKCREEFQDFKNPFYWITERNQGDVGEIQALKDGVIYFDKTKLLEAPLRYAVETAEEVLCRYGEIKEGRPPENSPKKKKKGLLLQDFNNIQEADAPVLASFFIAYMRALAFAGGTRAVYTEYRGPNSSWIEALTGKALPTTFEKFKDDLLASAKKLDLVPKAFELPKQR